MESNPVTQEYLGYVIRTSSDPWAHKFNMPIEYFKPDGDGQIHGAGSIEDAKMDIDARLDEFMESLDKTTKSL